MSEAAAVVRIDDTQLLDAVLRSAAALGCPVERAGDDVLVRARWSGDAVLVLDGPAARAAVAADLPRRDGLVVVCAERCDDATWSAALALGARCVVRMPREQRVLSDALAEGTHRLPETDGAIVSVVGGRGGAGASVFSAATALVAARRGTDSLLIDCDALGGGIDLAVGMEAAPGMRWPDLRMTDGRIAADALRAALPTDRVRGGTMAVLSCDRAGHGPSPSALAAVLAASVRSGGTAVCDLPRSLDEVAAVAVRASAVTVLVVPAELRACAAAARVADGLRALGAEPVAVIRGPAPGGLRPADAAAEVGVPLLVGMRSELSLPEAVENGSFRLRRRSPLLAAAASALDRCGEPRAELSAA